MAALPARLVATTTDSAATVDKILCVARRLAGSVEVEEITSYFWWKGAVQKDAETRISFVTSEPLERIIESVGAVHNFDVPMIIVESADAGTYWKGVVEGGGAELASTLTESRLVACAQLAQVDAQHQSLAIKTTVDAKPRIDALLAGVHNVRWTPIAGNGAYMDWLWRETHAERGA
ncbi:hypothetical protein KFE25_008830 [Diacronema lutheri]|uniref:Divalent-cation tolerance protein CutA n=1 Tax=Diacronema lutheri TaxID=2081491 RepID=A0A8J6CF76_DIALT|nr:hypothetical protein KFE25_008830 [Diacronema lutheri]